MAAMQPLRKFYLAAICFYIMIWTGHCDIRELYSTRQKTEPLRWAISGEWEELTGLDMRDMPIRFYQVCKSNDPNQDNWIRSTYIGAKKGQRLHVQIKFSIVKCDSPDSAEDKYCRDTFNLFYYESNTDVASSTFPPRKKSPYIKVATVAANTNINNKTFTVGPLRRNGFYVAFQDQGACMSITGLRVYYYYCPEKIAKLATFPMTNAGGEATSLVPSQGTCVASAQRTNGDIPTYHCNSDGKWIILTGGCQCDPGYQQNSDATLCQPCSPGTFKPDAGNDDCVVCPANSGLAPTSNTAASARTIGLDFCPCIPGFFRALYEPKTMPCFPSVGASFNDAHLDGYTIISGSWARRNVIDYRGFPGFALFGHGTVRSVSYSTIRYDAICVQAYIKNTQPNELKAQAYQEGEMKDLHTFSASDVWKLEKFWFTCVSSADTQVQLQFVATGGSNVLLDEIKEVSDSECESVSAPSSSRVETTIYYFITGAVVFVIVILCTCYYMIHRKTYGSSGAGLKLGDGATVRLANLNYHVHADSSDKASAAAFEIGAGGKVSIAGNVNVRADARGCPEVKEGGKKKLKRS